MTVFTTDNVAGRFKGTVFQKAVVFHPRIVVDLTKVARAMVGQQNHHYVVICKVFTCPFQRPMYRRPALPQSIR